MIEWKKFECDNHPGLTVEYLVTNGEYTKKAKLYEYFDCTLGWEDVGGNCLTDVTHYSEINLPTEEG